MSDSDIEEQRKSPSAWPASPTTHTMPPRQSPLPSSSPTPYYCDEDDGGLDDDDDGGGSESDQSRCSHQEEQEIKITTATTDRWAMEAAAQELETRLANLRQYSNWRFNTRQYPSSPALESQHALWALRQTASGGLSLVLPTTIEEEEGEDGSFHLHRGKSLSTAIDEIQGLMSRRASRAWTRSATIAGHSGVAPSSSSSFSFARSLPSFARRRQPPGEGGGGGGRNGRVSLGPGIGSSSGRGVRFHQETQGAGIAGGKEEEEEGENTAPMSSTSEREAAAVGGLDSLEAQQEQLEQSEQSLLHASLLSSKSPPLWTAWERLAWTGGDYLMSLLVFVTLSITWWRGAWNLLDHYVYPNNRPLRVLILMLVAILTNVLAFLSYPRLRQWSRRISCQRESYVYGGVKRLVLLVRMLASVMHWTGVWDALDGIFCESDNVDDPCSYDQRGLLAITCVGLAGLVAMRQMNGAVWGPLFSVSLDFQCEIVLDTSLRFNTDRTDHTDPPGTDMGRSHRFSQHTHNSGGSSSSESRRKGGKRALVWHVLDILATQWVPDVFAIFSWYGFYTWLPLRWQGTTMRAELVHVAASMGVAVGCYAAQFVLAGWVDESYPRRGGSSSSSRAREREGLGRSSSMSSDSGSRSPGRQSVSSLGAGSTNGTISGGPQPLPLPPPSPPLRLHSPPAPHPLAQAPLPDHPPSTRLTDNALCVVPPFLSGKYLAELFLYLWAFVAANLLWVFFWNLLDDHFLPSRPLLSNWLCALGGLSLEFILNVASTEVAGGVYLDGAGEGSSGLFFPVCYFGELAAYRASIKSASTYALYRRSTAAAIMAASSSSIEGGGGEVEGGGSPMREITLSGKMRSLSLSVGEKERSRERGRAGERKGEVVGVMSPVSLEFGRAESRVGLLADEAGRSTGGGKRKDEGKNGGRKDGDKGRRKSESSLGTGKASRRGGDFA